MAAEKKALAKSRPNIFGRIFNFFNESWQELKKVSWPSGKEVKNFTLVVIAAVIFVGVCLFCFDWVLTQFTRDLFEGKR